MKQYKLVYARGDAQVVEQLVNKHAADGYTLDKVLPASEANGYFWYPTYIMVKEVPTAVPVKYT